MFRNVILESINRTLKKFKPYYLCRMKLFMKFKLTIKFLNNKLALLNSNEGFIVYFNCPNHLLKISLHAEKGVQDHYI